MQTSVPHLVQEVSIFQAGNDGQQQYWKVNRTLSIDRLITVRREYDGQIATLPDERAPVELDCRRYTSTTDGERSLMIAARHASHQIVLN
jgi:hypothetical protein